MSLLSVQIGNVSVGAGAPVSIQSMTNTDTADVEKTVYQIDKLQKAGCEIVRVSVYNQYCAAAIKKIKAITAIPIVADIHFDYKLAIMAAENGADKLRINPGNISQNKAKMILDAAKTAHIPIRVGVNAGSVPADILAKHGGPTAGAIVEAALGHIAVLEKNKFFDIVVSLKSSDVTTNINAYRLMTKTVDYPLHIGVTEAGWGNDAVIKSSIGIGTLLLDGIGDTLRVSITGDPIQEVELAKRILTVLGIRKSGIEIISCPTCGRCSVDLLAIASQIKKDLPKTEKYIRLAIMGCVVNGPGEAKESDLGVAFGDGKCAIFKNGECFKTIEIGCLNSVIKQEIEKIIQEK